MNLQIIKKSLIGGSISLLLTSCVPEQKTVYCHQWSKQEKKQIGAVIDSLDPQSPIHDIDRDYQRVCDSLAL